MKCNLKEGVEIDSEKLRLLQLDEKTKPGSEVDIPSEALWRAGVYDVDDFEEKLGQYFEKPKGLKRKPIADAKNVDAKEKRLAKATAEIEEEARDDIEKAAAKEAKS